MPVEVDNLLEQAEGLTQALNNHKDVITAKGNGQKKIDDLARATKILSRIIRAR